MSIKPFMLALLALFFVVPAFSATVCVVVVESGVPDEEPIVEASSAWEGGVLDALFNAGFIVCNADMARRAQIGLPEPSYGLDAAREGGADYVALISLDYAPDPVPVDASGKKIRISPRAVFYRLSNVDGKSLFEGRDTALPAAVDGKEDMENARKVVRSILKGMKDK